MAETTECKYCGPITGNHKRGCWRFVPPRIPPAPPGFTPWPADLPPRNGIVRLGGGEMLPVVRDANGDAIVFEADDHG